jgi:hypothetical protein
MDGTFEDWIEPVDPPGAGDDPPSPQVPMTARRSRRWVLLPPVLMSCVAMSVLAYRVWSPDWQGIYRMMGLRIPRAIARATPVAAAPVEMSPLMTELATSSPYDPSLLPPSALTARGARRSPTRLASLDGPGTRVHPPRPDALPDDLASNAAALLAAGSPLARAGKRAWEDILKAAEDRRAARENFEALKPALEVHQALEVGSREVKEAQKQRQEVEADRDAFRAELRAIVDRLGEKAGPSIRELTQKHFVPVPPNLEKKVERALQNGVGRLDAKARLQLRRTYGLPEPLILEELAAEEMRKISARTGPRNADEAFVRAARQLLAVPITAPPPPETRNSSVTRRPVRAR